MNIDKLLGLQWLIEFCRYFILSRDENNLSEVADITGSIISKPCQFHSTFLYNFVTTVLTLPLWVVVDKQTMSSSYLVPFKSWIFSQLWSTALPKKSRTTSEIGSISLPLASSRSRFSMSWITLRHACARCGSAISLSVCLSVSPPKILKYWNIWLLKSSLYFTKSYVVLRSQGKHADTCLWGQGTDACKFVENC